VDNFVHADMHPGNILVRVVRPKNTNNTLQKSRPHVVFLDVGMTAELDSNDRVNLLEFFKAVARRDGRTAAESTLKLSKQQNCPNPKVFIEVYPLIANTLSRLQTLFFILNCSFHR
jgi:aarF domain-containing kinase